MNYKFCVILISIITLIALVEGGEYLAIKLKNKSSIFFRILSGIITVIIAIIMFIILVVIILILALF